MLAREQSLHTATVRLYLTYGPGQDQNRLIPQVINSCLKNKNFKASSGDQVRDFCYVDDVTDGIIASLMTKETDGEIINLGTGIPVTVKEVVDKIQKIIGKGQPQFGMLRLRQSEPEALFPDIDKAKRLLNWAPVFTLEKGLENTVAWYINNHKLLS